MIGLFPGKIKKCPLNTQVYAHGTKNILHQEAAFLRFELKLRPTLDDSRGHTIIGVAIRFIPTYQQRTNI